MDTSTSAQRALIVDTDALALSRLRNALVQAHYEVLHADTFEGARQLLTSHRPSILIANVRLGAYNAVHLLMHGRRVKPDLFGVITSPFPDAVLQAEVSRLGGAYFVAPLDLNELLDTLARRAQRDLAGSVPYPDRRLGERRHLVVPGFIPERRMGDRRRHGA